MFLLSEIVVLVVVFRVSLAKVPNFPEEFNDDENRQYIKEEVVLSNDNQNSANHFSELLPGDTHLDYPTYTEIPRTSFSCKGKVNWRYYADIDTECQVFHICESEYTKVSFVCPIGSVFNQRHLVCDWWYNFDCNDAVGLYTLSNDFNEERELSTEVENTGDRAGFDLSLASSGGNSDPYENTDVKIKNYTSENKAGDYKYNRQRNEQ